MPKVHRFHRLHTQIPAKLRTAHGKNGAIEGRADANLLAILGQCAEQTDEDVARALVKLLAWRLDIAHVDPSASVVYASGGNSKYPAGKKVTLKTISGHRDTYFTECPGNALYALLPTIRQRVAQTGLPKLYSPAVTGCTTNAPPRRRSR